MKEQTPSHDQGCATILAKVLLMTETMLALAHENSWDAITELEEERKEALKACFTDPISVSQTEIFAEALAAMLHMNEEIIGLLEVAKENVAIKRTDQQYAKRSLAHYLDAEKDH